MGREDLRQQAGVRYRELRARTLLNRCDSPRMPFTWTVNPYRGCAMGCRYCYAAYTHEFMGIETPEEFHTTVFVKRGAEAGTAAVLGRIVRSGKRIALGTATDPYQPGEARERVTRRFLEMVAQHRNVRLGITTKGSLVLRDLDLLVRIHRRSTPTSCAGWSRWPRPRPCASR
jgi:DNA repair photolyase